MKKTFVFFLMAALAFGAKAENATLLKSTEGIGPFIERSSFNFYWGFTNWGGTTFGGLMGANEGTAAIRTSFSSYQLSYSFYIVNREHFNAGIGLGYESDVYKFKDSYVTWSGSSFQTSTPDVSGDWSTRFVTRYVQVPIHIGWVDKKELFSVRLSAIPAIGYANNNTGLKHRMKEDGQTHKDQTNLSDALFPYKLDVRLEFKVYGVGLFMQVSTFKLFKDGYQDLYPFKFGFVI